MTDSELIKNHTIFFAYFCHLIENHQTDSPEVLCDIGFKLEDEINRRNITGFQIEEYMKNANLDPQDRLMVNIYLYPDLDEMKDKVGQS